MRRLPYLLLGCVLALGTGCGDDDDTMTMDTGTDGAADAMPDTTMPDVSPDVTEDTGGETAARFILRIENISSGGPLGTPFAPGVAVATSEDAPLFRADEADRGEGLAAIAEDGNAMQLASAIDGAVMFNTPDGEDAPGPAFPGGAYEVEITAEPGDKLSFATMVVQTNDVFLAPDEAGIELFDADGAPLAERDVTDLVSIWDVGSEANEAPGAGPNQAPRQGGPDTGAAEGVVRAFTGSTHALPLPSALMGVEVTEAGGVYTFTLTNTAPDSGALLAPFSPVLWASHDDTASFFAIGEEASPGIEAIAEDGNASIMAAALGGLASVADSGIAGAGPVMGGDSVSFDVTPSAASPLVSFATMMVQSNDAFFALSPAGVSLLDDADEPRAAADVQADVLRDLALWDAGTEADQIPGFGPDQAPRQAGPDTGADDPNAVIRRHADATNMLADLDGLIDVTIVNSAIAGTFDVTVSTTGVAEGFPIITPVVHAVHSSAASLFTEGAPASPALEPLAEDGDPSMLETALGMDVYVLEAGVQAIPDGAAAPGPAMPGNSYSFSVTPDAGNNLFSFATMIVPSNDLFLAFGPGGIALLDDAGAPRSDADIAADIASELRVWDAGTEQNQSGAGGADQAPRQSGPNTGEAEGNGLVRAVPDGVWVYPAVADMARITIRPAE